MYSRRFFLYPFFDWYFLNLHASLQTAFFNDGAARNQQWPRTRVANFASLLRRPPTDFLLDLIQSPDALDRFGALYEIEKEIRGRPPEERREVRNTRSRPLLVSLHHWLQASLAKLSKKSDTSAAIRYAL